jgi:Protein of unknown function (DUF3592)
VKYEVDQLTKLTQEWSVPAELTGSPPRQVVYSAGGIFIMLLMIALMVGGAVLAWSIYNNYVEQRDAANVLAAQGAETGGTVTRRWRGGSKNRQYRIAYEFHTGGQVFHGEAAIRREAWESLSEGQRLAVRYAAGNPEVNRPANLVETPQPPIWQIALIPAFLVGMSAFLLHRARRQRSLLENGRAAAGVITRMRRTKHGRSIRYDFLLPGGRTGSGSGMAKRGNSDEGSVITVVYDPDDPTRSGPYPFEMVKLAR